MWSRNASASKTAPISRVGLTFASPARRPTAIPRRQARRPPANQQPASRFGCNRSRTGRPQGVSKRDRDDGAEQSLYLTCAAFSESLSLWRRQSLPTNSHKKVYHDVGQSAPAACSKLPASPHLAAVLGGLVEQATRRPQ